MHILCLLAVILGLTVQDVAKKSYCRRVTDGVYSFSAAAAGMSMVFFLLFTGGSFSFTAQILPYSIVFAVTYSTAVIFSLLAVSTGPLALTALVVSCSLLLPTVYGLVFLNEPVSAFLFIGVVCLLGALILINLEKKGEPRQITPKWLLYVFLAFAGNGVCTITQKVQQMGDAAAYKNEFMLLGLALSSAFLFAAAFLRERRGIWKHLKSGLPWYSIFGGANGVVNLCVLILAKDMPASVMFPVISAGSIVVTFFVSIFLYKERLSVWQTVGVALGALSVVFLNL